MPAPTFGVIAALKTEIAPTIRALSENEGFVFKVSGVGAVNARRTAEALGDCGALISAGFCGALSDDLYTGQILVSGNAALIDLARRAEPNAREAKIMSANRVLVDADSKRTLARESGAAAVDMEAAFVADVAKARAQKFLAVKVVFDTLAEPLASGYENIMNVMAQMVRRPLSTIAGLWRDAARARVCADKLRQFFLEFARSALE